LWAENRLKHLVAVILCSLSIGLSEARAFENPLFGYTHMQPSPFTLPGGKFAIGTTMGIGITDHLQFSTDVISDFFKVFNGRFQYSLLDFPGLVFALTLGYQYVNLNDISSSNPSLGVHSIMPGGVLGTEVVPYVAVFVGGNFFISNVNVSGSGIDTSGYVQGGQVGTDISWAYQPQETRTGNVFSTGFTYNTTYGVYGVGLSHHWRGFRLGFHYYPNATTYKLMPIVAGGAVVDL